MDARLRNFLNDFYESCREHDAGLDDRLERWRNLEPESAQFLAVLVRAAGPSEILELGTSNGYSTCWLVDAAHDVSGAGARRDSVFVTSVDNDPARTRAARETLKQAGLTEHVQLVTDDAGAYLAALEDESQGLIFLDAERPAYGEYWPALRRVLRPGGVLVVDNVLSHAEQVSDFLVLVDRDSEFTSVTVPTGAGLLVTTKALDA